MRCVVEFGHNDKPQLLLCFIGFNTRPQQALLLNWHQLPKERARTEGKFHNLCRFTICLLVIPYISDCY